jgi:hypothetical protein
MRVILFLFLLISFSCAGQDTHFDALLRANTFESPAGDPVVTVTRVRDLVTGARWYGRTSMKVLPSGITVMAYREGDAHADNGDDVINVMFSNNYGESWSEPNTYLDGTPIVGMPSYPANATPSDDEGPGEPWLYLCPNGDLLIHMWSCDYGVTNQGTYQTRSTDGGLTWSAPEYVNFIYEGAPYSRNDHIFSTDDDFVKDGIIYAGAREYQAVDSYGTAIRSWFIKTEDNGETWELVSLVSSYDDVTNEYGMTYVGNNEIVAMVRQLVTVAYQTRSYDFGATWEPLKRVDQELGVMSRQRVNTRAQLQRKNAWWNDPVVICHGFVHVTQGSSTPRRIAVWISKDRGLTWSAPFYMDDAGEDGGYGSLIYNRIKNEYVYTVYFAPIGDTGLTEGIVRQYNFTLDFE